MIETSKGIGFVKGKRSSGYFTIMDSSGQSIFNSVNVKRGAVRLSTSYQENERRDSMSISSSMSDEEFISLSEENQATASNRYRAIVDAHRAAIGDWANRTEMVKEDGWWVKKFVEPTDTKMTTHSRDAFRYLVQHYPEKLLSWIRDGTLKTEDLTFATEIAGSIPVELGSQDVLVGLLQHPEALVREGAVLGLWRQAPLPENILAMLHGLAAHDSSNAVRKTVFDVLEHHENQETDKPNVEERQKDSCR